MKLPLPYFWRIDPVNLTGKGKLLAVIACFSAILLVALSAQAVVNPIANPVMIASMGASAVILFVIPGSPLAQPWPLVGGHLVSALIGLFCAQWIADANLAAAAAVGGSVLLMLLLRCPHPPGAATALIPVLADPALGLGDYHFLLMPVGLNVVTLLISAMMLNRWLLGHTYPADLRPVTTHLKDNRLDVAFQPGGISEQDLEGALVALERYIDVSPSDLSQLFSEAQLQHFKRQAGAISCAEIMIRNVAVVEYGSEVEEAWRTMHKQQIKALPVIDKARRVIGIITWHDFFKFIDADTTPSLRDKFRHFICRTPDVTANKPEAVGHIMSSPVKVVPENTHIAALIPLMSEQGYRQIPIVNHENRLVGMVYQSSLIAALSQASQQFQI